MVSGMLVALASLGATDEAHMRDLEKARTLTEIRSWRHCQKRGEVLCTHTHREKAGRVEVSFVLDSQATSRDQSDVLGDFVLNLRLGTDKLDDVLSSVTLMVGRTKEDELRGPKIESLIEVWAALAGSRIERVGEDTFVPLPLATLRKTEYLPLAASGLHSTSL